jgi:hypothetical protein
MGLYERLRSCATPFSADVASLIDQQPRLRSVANSVLPIARKTFQLPSESFFNTISTVPRTCFVSPAGDSTYEEVKVRHSMAQPPSRKVKSLVSGT